MRGNELLEKMDLVDWSYVETADCVPPKKNYTLGRWVAVAACLGIVSIGIWKYESNDSSQYENLLKVNVSELNATMGFEGYLCYDISELDNGNPWSESINLSTLPVYKNQIYDSSGAGVPKGWNEDEMNQQLEQTAELLEIEILEIKTIRDGLFLTEMEARTDQGNLVVYANGMITYYPNNIELKMPELLETYDKFLDFKESKVVVLQDYTFDGEMFQDYMLYDAAGNEMEDILNYNFNHAEIVPSYDGKVFLIRKQDQLSLAEKVGDYPIISVKEATRLLVDGKYQTSVPYDFAGKKYIEKIELIYRTGSSEEYLLPYYRFYVELTEEKNDNGLKTYGAYYVPAVEKEYIYNIELLLNYQ